MPRQERRGRGDPRHQERPPGRDPAARRAYGGHARARQDDRRYLIDRAPDEDRWYGRDLDEELDHRIDRGFSRDADERHDERALFADRRGSGRSFQDIRPRYEERGQERARPDD
jgi:hypothetical protein